MKMLSMIQAATTYIRGRCGSINITKNGTNKCGKAQYHCKDCGAYRVLTPKGGYSAEQKAQVLAGYQERMSLCRRTRQIVAFVIGDRSEATCRQLLQAIPEPYRACRSYSDFWRAYEAVLPAETHHCVGKETGLTAHQERWYCTLRQRLARYVRQTLSFSKKDANHDAVTRWFITEYNLRIRSSLTFLPLPNVFGAWILSKSDRIGTRRKPLGFSPVDRRVFRVALAVVFPVFTG